MIRARTVFIALLLTVPLTSRAAPAHADETAHATGDALLRHGVELRREHKNEEALAEFQRAFTIEASPIARAQIALAEQALGRWVEAERDLAAALEAQDDAWVLRNRPLLDEAMTTIRQNLGVMDLSLNVQGAEVLLDGHTLAPGLTRVPSGVGVLQVRAPGYVPDIRRVDIAQGEVPTKVTVALVPFVVPNAVPAQAAPPPPESPPRSAPRSRVAPLVLGAVGIVGLGVGSYFGVQTLNLKSDRDALPKFDPAAAKDNSDAHTSATASNVAFIAGAACVVTSVTWLLLTRDASPPRASVAPLVDRNVAGIVVQGAL